MSQFVAQFAVRDEGYLQHINLLLMPLLLLLLLLLQRIKRSSSTLTPLRCHQQW